MAVGKPEIVNCYPTREKGDMQSLVEVGISSRNKCGGFRIIIKAK